VYNSYHRGYLLMNEDLSLLYDFLFNLNLSYTLPDSFLYVQRGRKCMMFVKGTRTLKLKLGFTHW